MAFSFPRRIQQLQEEIIKLKEAEDIVLMAHYYQRPEIQAIADVLGDSLGLSRTAQKMEKSGTIVFAGVKFMAETASILNPDKNVYIPDTGAECPMAQMCPASEIVSIKQQYDYPVVLYVNTLAEAKAQADIMCTSANAVKICQSLNSDAVIFGPDWNLGWHVWWKTGLQIIPVPEQGYCYVHRKFLPEDFQKLKRQYPEAQITVHPECSPEVQQLADHVGSTEQIKNFILNSDSTDFIIGTEVGLEFAIQKENTLQKNLHLHFAREDAVCLMMKLITLEKIRDVIVRRPEANLVKVPDHIANGARKSIQRMLDLS